MCDIPVVALIIPESSSSQPGVHPLSDSAYWADVTSGFLKRSRRGEI